MGNRCEQCQKFVGLEAAEPEVNSTEVQSAAEILDDGTQEVEVGASVELVLNCADCGGEMGRVSVDGSETLKLEHGEYKPDPEDLEEGDDPEALVKCDAGEDDLEIEETGSDNDDDYRPAGRPMRYQKHYYLGNISVKVTCNKCGAEVEGTIVVEAQASEFEQ